LVNISLLDELDAMTSQVHTAIAAATSIEEFADVGLKEARDLRQRWAAFTDRVWEYVIDFCHVDPDQEPPELFQLKAQVVRLNCSGADALHPPPVPVLEPSPPVPPEPPPGPPSALAFLPLRFSIFLQTDWRMEERFRQWPPWARTSSSPFPTASEASLAERACKARRARSSIWPPVDRSK